MRQRPWPFSLFDSDDVPRVGEHVVVGPDLNVGDIHNTDERIHTVLQVV